MRVNYDQAKWKDYTLDLSQYAGQSVTLRLQVEPGPKNNASWDYSFFGNAQITVGQTTRNVANLLSQITRSQAYHAPKDVSRARLSNSPTHGVTPSNLLPGKNALTRIGSKWQWSYEGADGRLAYSYEPKTGTLDDFTVQVGDSPAFQPALGGGATVILAPDKNSSPMAVLPKQVPARGGKARQISRTNDILRVLWEYETPGQPLQIAWTFRMRGKAMLVSAQCNEPRVSRFSLGEVGQVSLRKTFNIPYLLGKMHYLPEPKVFVCRYLDWTVSHASMCPQGVATYEPKTDGVRNPLFESGYVAVSPDVGEVLPNIPHPPSPYRTELGPRIMLDIWGHHRGTFAGDAENLRELKDNGVDHLVIIQHVWQRYGYDVKLPDHIPANPAYGGDKGMIAFGRAANDCGYVWSLHENYIDLYPDAPSYDPTARVLRSDGSPSPAWYNAGTKVQSFGLKCNRALGYAKQNSPEIHRRYHTTAAYLDVHACVPPWHQLDHEASQPMAAMALAKVNHDTELFQFERDTHGGPLFGEGANHFYWAGRCDGVEAQVVGGEDHSALLDFDLLKLHPQMVNHGMGYYERWFRRGYEAQWGVDAGSVEQLDKYRAMELAYGHAGFIGNRLAHNVQAVVREHHLMHPVQRLYGTAKPVAIDYEVDGQWVNASAALAVGDTSRQRIRYDSGLTLWVNWRAEPWKIEVAVADEASAFGAKGRSRTVVLPQWGFLALGANTEVSTALRDGTIADYAQCPEYLFADARTWFDLPYRNQRKDIEPRLRSFRYLGGNRAEVTYEWIVNETLAEDYHCFVHGIPVNGTEADGIDFQQDHRLPKPTSEWRAGDVIVDGPYELRLPAKRNQYDLVIGLFKGPRLPLKGVQALNSRILLARLQLERTNGTISNIIAAQATPDMEVQTAAEADFHAHTNPVGTWINFGVLATDGAVKINREPNRLVIFPYPRNRNFRLSLDWALLPKGIDPSTISVRALATSTQRDLGPVEFRNADGQLQIPLGTPGAGRYVVAWR